MEQDATGLRWGVERRLEFIEFRLFWEGAINRSDLMDHFGVSTPQASKDLSLYQDLAPGNLDYDKRGKRYLPAPGFKPRFFRPDADRYLTQLRSVAEGAVPKEESLISSAPDLGCMPIPHRQVDPDILRALLAAVRGHQAVEIRYQSMNPDRPDPVWRTISPHAFGSDGLRWHVRAYCHMTKAYKDFLISRCIELRDSFETSVGPSGDQQWHEYIELTLVPNQKLSKSQQNVIARDYAMSDHHLRITIRRALLYYFNKRLRLDVAEALDQPQEVPLVVANKAEFNDALKQAAA